jgi:hypothetical protein
MTDPQKSESLTVRKHKSQFAWQILVPFLVMAGLIITGAVLVVSRGPQQARLWADVSTIWILAPMLAFALVIAVVLGFGIFGLAKLTQITPHYTGKAQELAAGISTWTRKVADGIVKPVLWLKQAGAAMSSLFHK